MSKLEDAKLLENAVAKDYHEAVAKTNQAYTEYKRLEGVEKACFNIWRDVRLQVIDLEDEANATPGK